MNLSMTGALADRFKSGSQKAGNVTEAWGAENFYCPNCSSPKLDWLKPGTKASDYQCPACGFWFQLKSQKSRIGQSITDGAYRAMMEAIREDRAPSHFFLHYEICGSRRESAQTSPPEFQMEPIDIGCHGSGEEIWLVRNLLVVPYFAFPPSAIIKRPPLAASARRAGWIGCNFDLSRIPAEARIQIVRTVKRSGTGFQPVSELKRKKYEDRQDACPTIIVPPAEVRAQFRRVKPFANFSVEQRGWMLDVLNIVRRICDRSSERQFAPSSPRSRQENQSRLTSAATGEFTNADVYAHARELGKVASGQSL